MFVVCQRIFNDVWVRRHRDQLQKFLLVFLEVVHDGFCGCLVSITCCFQFHFLDWRICIQGSLIFGQHSVSCGIGCRSSQKQNISTPVLTIDKVFFSSNAAPVFLQTHLWWICPKNSNLLYLLVSEMCLAYPHVAVWILQTLMLVMCLVRFPSNDLHADPVSASMMHRGMGHNDTCRPSCSHFGVLLCLSVLYMCSFISVFLGIQMFLIPAALYASICLIFRSVVSCSKC